jgi:hypothetical protein
MLYPANRRRERVPALWAGENASTVVAVFEKEEIPLAKYPRGRHDYSNVFRPNVPPTRIRSKALKLYFQAKTHSTRRAEPG